MRNELLTIIYYWKIKLHLFHFLIRSAWPVPVLLPCRASYSAPVVLGCRPVLDNVWVLGWALCQSPAWSPAGHCVQAEVSFLVLVWVVDYFWISSVCLCVCLPAGCGWPRQAAGPGLSCLRAEGVGADGRYGSSHQAAPCGDVDVHLRGSQEGFAWGGKRDED